VIGVSVYLFVQLTVHDRELYDRYSDAVPATLEPHGGKVIVADDSPRVIEGEWSANRVVVLEFPDRDAFRAWGTSPAYQAIVGDRRASAETVALFVRGL
jgi:uncharacterized protein (DUF1330 family)